MTHSSSQEGTTVRAGTPVIRALDRTRAPAAVDAVFAGLSQHSRNMRFHSPVSRLPAAVRARLVDVDGRRHATVVAEVAGVGPIGLAEVVGDGQGTAEVAVAVVDAWQRRGIGRRLLTTIAAVAEDIGYTGLRGIAMPDNVAVLGLARTVLPGARPRYAGGAVQFTASIGEAP